MQEAHTPEQRPYLIVLSAKNEEGLKLYARKIVNFLEKTHVGLIDLAYTLQVGRESMEERLAFLASSLEEVKEKLVHYCQGMVSIDDLYRGNIKAKGLKTNFLVSGKTGEEFVRAIIDERELSKLAQLWVSGADIGWRLLYPACTPQRISLPTYPFARERHWIAAHRY